MFAIPFYPNNANVISIIMQINFFYHYWIVPIQVSSVINHLREWGKSEFPSGNFSHLRWEKLPDGNYDLQTYWHNQYQCIVHFLFISYFLFAPDTCGHRIINPSLYDSVYPSRLPSVRQATAVWDVH